MKNRILFFNTEQKHTVLCNLTCKKVASRQMKQLKELQPSDPPLLPNTATGIPTEPAMMQNLLVKSLPVESPVNMHMPHLVSEQIWAHLFIHYRQMLTEGKLKATCVSPAVDITESTQENTRASPKKPEGMKRCIAGEEAPWSAWHLSVPVNEDRIGEYLSATYIYFNLLKSHVEKRTNSECFYTFTVAGKYVSLRSTCSIYPSHFASGLLKGKFTAWHQEWKNRQKNPYWHIKLDMFAGPPEIAITVLQLLWMDYGEKHWLLPGNSTC